MRGRIAPAGCGQRRVRIWGGLGGREMAGRLALARPGGAWVLGIQARARGGPRARRRELSAPELTERVTEGHRPPGGGGVRGRPRKATSEVREELGQEGVAALERADAAEPQFAGEAILECAPEPFDAALRLR